MRKMIMTELYWLVLCRKDMRFLWWILASWGRGRADRFIPVQLAVLQWPMVQDWTDQEKSGDEREVGQMNVFV
jgi:hypothetical protein